MKTTGRQWNVKRSFALWGVLCVIASWGSAGVKAQDGASSSTPNVEGTPKPRHWSANTAIGTILDSQGNVTGYDGRMTGPQNQAVPTPVPARIIVKSGDTLSCSVEPATDMDHWTRDDNDGNPNNNDDYNDDLGDSADGVNYTWSGGNFKTGTNSDGTSITATEVSGTNATWIAPTTPGRYTISCRIDDTPTPVESPETGTRDDVAVIRSVSVIVPSLSLRFLQSKIAVGAISNNAHKAKFEIKATDDQGYPISGVDVGEPEVVSGGLGPYEDVTASVEMDGAVSGSDGIVQGTLTSGHRTEVTVIQIKANLNDPNSSGPSASVGQVWNELPNSEMWEFDPYFDYDEASTITFNMAYNREEGRVPIPGHTLDPSTTAILGYEWNPDIGDDWDGDGVPDGDYEAKTYREDDTDSSGFNQWNGLVEWGDVTDNGGSYNVDQTIEWSDNFIVDSVYFWMWDNESYGSNGAED